MLIILAVFSQSRSYGQLLLHESFSYTLPATIGGNGATGTSNNNWTTHSVTAGQTTTDTLYPGSLNFPGLIASTGEKLHLFSYKNAISRDVNSPLVTNASTVMYFSALINVLDTAQIKTTADYFMSFGATAGSSVTSLGGRLGIKAITSATSYRLSISNISGGTPTYTDFAQDLNCGTTYLVVVKYDRSTNPTTASLWVDPVATSFGGTEPAGSVTNATGTNTFAAFASMCIRNSANTPKVEIDEIRVGSTWAEVTPAGTVAAPTKLVVTSINGGTDPYVNTGFYAVVQSQDASSVAANVTANVNYTITLSTGTGTLGGTLTGTIPTGANTDTIFGITYNTVETGVSITATDNAAGLTAGTSALFNVLALPPTAVKLAITDVNSGINPYIGATFNATIKAWDNSNNPVNVVTPVNITLSALYGTGTLGGTLTGTIASGTNSVTITGITYNVAENNIALKVVDDASTLIADTSALFNVLAIPAAPAIVITEIMYNPPESGTDSLEFVEFYNNGSAAVPLKNFTFNVVGSGTYTFKDDTIAAAGYYLIAVDSVKFHNFYGQTAHKWNFGGLGNTGKTLLLKDSFTTLVDSVSYLNVAPWPTAAAGNGSSITLCDPNADNSLAASWQASDEIVSTDSVNHKIVRATPGAGCLTTDIYSYNVSNYSVNCFPNPVRETLTLSLEGRSNEIEIYDMLGNIVYSTTTPSAVTTINTEKMNKGIYIVKVQFNDNSVVTKKITVM